MGISRIKKLQTQTSGHRYKQTRRGLYHMYPKSR